MTVSLIICDHYCL